MKKKDKAEKKRAALEPEAAVLQLIADKIDPSLGRFEILTGSYALPAKSRLRKQPPFFSVLRTSPDGRRAILLNNPSFDQVKAFLGDYPATA